ncbi:TetR/AcrR family transcriptional regulator [Antrihabitans stalactiti]|uniref:TetR/AcrR family transcriptional regulator n=1 Tax=Antrihabitans stalactiti TaxID=2584121 RepID=A0A848KES0_9NOCA|nr:TetR/AcrR family transcriptional regulator [Antrihabitans stalactiti]NMN96721.1 TetR/AcrR family transcriptional regulator [Antrihabitans stalactiti]
MLSNTQRRPASWIEELHGRRRDVRSPTTPADYFSTATAILVAKGHHALKMTTVCKALGVTTGSFYNYFDSWGEFVNQLLSHWEREQLLLMEKVMDSGRSGPATDLCGLRTIAAHLSNKSGTAFRAWATGDPLVAEVQRRIDERRSTILTRAIRTAVSDDATARRLTVVILTLLVGSQFLPDQDPSDGFLLEYIEDLVRRSIVRTPR